MLRNLSDNLCVSKFEGMDYDQWACYEPLTTEYQSKRQAWKRITGLMSADSMHIFLAKNYPAGHACNQFRAMIN